MRRKMVYALAEAVKKYDSIVVAVNRPLCPFTTWLRKPARLHEFFDPPGVEKIEDNLYLFSPKYFISDMVTRRLAGLNIPNLYFLRRSFGYLSRKLKIRISSPIIWLHHPVQEYLTGLFPMSLNVLEIYDNLVDV
ncbi:MAG: hypothetical protein GF404_00665, partial [candidate division Zixibacteria bacterium]|nr:hypothetical protein [candidate division Zixibacteria bacterium]